MPGLPVKIIDDTICPANKIWSVFFLEVVDRRASLSVKLCRKLAIRSVGNGKFEPSDVRIQYDIIEFTVSYYTMLYYHITTFHISF